MFYSGRETVNKAVKKKDWIIYLLILFEKCMQAHTHQCLPGIQIKGRTQSKVRSKRKIAVLFKAYLKANAPDWNHLKGGSRECVARGHFTQADVYTAPYKHKAIHHASQRENETGRNVK